jgi:hypothetical protein
MSLLSQDAGWKLGVCVIDCAIDPVTLGALRVTHDFPIVNHSNIHLHPRGRGARTVVSFEMAQRARKSGWRALHWQHRNRGWVSGDECRYAFGEEDEEWKCDLHVVDGQCQHARKLLAGEYDTIIALDVPLTEDDARNVFARWPAVKRIILAVHPYDGMLVTMLDQTAMYVPTANGRGEYHVQCPGADMIREDSLFWLKSLSADLLKVEALHDDNLAYRVFKITPRKALAAPPVSIQGWLVCKPQAAPGRYAVGDGEFLKYGPTFGVLLQSGTSYPVNLDELSLILQKSAGRDTTPTLLQRLALHAATGQIRQTPHDVLMHVATTFKTHDEVGPIMAGYEPSDAGCCGTGLFRLLTESRRSYFARINAARAGDGSRRQCGWLWLIFSLIALGGTVVPWPVQRCSIAEHLLAADYQCSDVGVANATHVCLGRLPEWKAANAPSFVPWVAHDCSWSWERGDPVWRALTGASSGIGLVMFAHAAPVAAPPIGDVVRAEYNRDPHQRMECEGPLGSQPFVLPSVIVTRAVKEVASDCEVRIKDVVDTGNHERDGLRAIGIVTTLTPVVHRPCQANEIVAACNRQCMCVPAHDEGYFDTLVARALERLPQIVEKVSTDFNEWTSRFPQVRQWQHAAAMRLWNGEWAPTDGELSHGKSFVKVEKVFGDKDPRCISGQQDVLNVVAGPWVYALNKSFRKMFGLNHHVLYCDGYTAAEIGAFVQHRMGGATDKDWFALICGDDQLIAYYRGGRWYFVEVDGTRHDAHMHSGFFKLKWAVYAAVTDIPVYITRYYKRLTEFTTAQFPHGVSYSHPFRVRSGDADTKLGNSLCTWAVVEEIVDHLHAADGVASGMESARESLLQRCGYEIEYKVSEELSDVSFLSGLLVPVYDTLYWVPKPGRLMDRIGWTTTAVTTTHQIYRQLAGTLNSFQAYRFLPFWRVYLENSMRLIPEEYRLTPPSENRQIDSTGILATEPSAETWAFFAARYGLTQRDEEAFSVHMARVTSLPYMVDSYVLERLSEVDAA